MEYLEPRSSKRPSTGDELSSLAERMSYMQALRVTFAVVILGSALVAPHVLGASLSDLVYVTAAFLLLSAIAEGLRRLAGRRGLAVVEGMLLVDAVYLALAGYATGGTQSPLRFLIYIHLIAVTLLASYRTGIKIAVWHGLLFFATFYAQVTEILPPLSRDSVAFDLEKPSAFNVVALLFVAVGTMAFSSINERELRRRKSDLEALTETARRLEDESEPNAIGRILLEGVGSAFGFRRGALLVAPVGRRGLRLLAYRGPAEPVDLSAGRLDSNVSEAWEDHDAKLVKKLDPDKDPRLAALFPFGENVIVVPLFAEGPIGILALEHAGRTSKIGRHVLHTVVQFAAHAALALRKAWLMEEVRRLADTDGLTQIANRRSFEARLEQELSRARRSGDQVSLVILDIDHFKQLNDTHGHQVGDEVLRRTGHALTETCRDFDTPARYGGEEFAIILPGCSQDESHSAGERLRTAIGRGEMPVPVTASGGVATFPVHASDPEALIRAADEALYESKRTGRNRLTSSRRRAPAYRVTLGSD